MFESLLSSLSDVLTNPVVVLLLCAIVVTLCFVLLVSRPPASILAVDSASGKVRIARRALHDLIEAHCLATAGVGRAKASVATRGGEVCTRVELRIAPGQRLDELSQRLQPEIAGLLRDNLGLEHVGPVDILVVGVTRED
jgi:hypothetical protein